MSDDRAGYNQVLKAAKNAIRRAEYWKAEHIIANVIIETLRIQNKALIEALEAAVAQYAGYPPEVLAEIAPEWLEKAMDALKQAGNQRV